MRQAKAARADVKGGEIIGAESDHRHPERLEPLESQGEIEDELRARAHDADRITRDRFEVRGFVEASLCAPVHAADSTGGHYVDARAGRDLHRRGDRRCTQTARREDRSDVAE